MMKISHASVKPRKVAAKPATKLLTMNRIMNRNNPVHPEVFAFNSFHFLVGVAEFNDLRVSADCAVSADERESDGY